MSNKFTSRERIAMIVVAGVVAIAIAALAMRRDASEPQPVAQPAAAVQRTIVADKPDTVTIKAKAKRSHRTKAQAKKTKPKVVRTPKARDYHISPEDE